MNDYYDLGISDDDVKEEAARPAWGIGSDDEDDAVDDDKADKDKKEETVKVSKKEWTKIQKQMADLQDKLTEPSKKKTKTAQTAKPPATQPTRRSTRNN